MNLPSENKWPFCRQRVWINILKDKHIIFTSQPPVIKCWFSHTGTPHLHLESSYNSCQLL